MRSHGAPAHDQPARRPAVTRADARTDERRRIVAQAAQAAADELPALADTTDAPELALMQRALDACRALRDAQTRSQELTALALACLVADEAEQ